MLDAAEIGVHVLGRPDPDEGLPAAGVLGADVDVPEYALGQDPVRTGIGLEEVDVVGDDREGVALEALGRRRQKAVVVALGLVSPEEGATRGEEPGAQERDDAPEHDEQDAPDRPVRSLLGRGCRGAVGGQRAPPNEDRRILSSPSRDTGATRSAVKPALTRRRAAQRDALQTRSGAGLWPRRASAENPKRAGGCPAIRVGAAPDGVRICSGEALVMPTRKERAR